MPAKSSAAAPPPDSQTPGPEDDRSKREVDPCPPELKAALPRECQVAMSCPPPVGLLPPPWGLRQPLLCALVGFFLPLLPLLPAGGNSNQLGLTLIAYTLQIAAFTLLPMGLVLERYHLPPDALGLRGLSWPLALLAVLAGGLLYGLSVLLSWLTLLVLPAGWLQGSSAVSLLESCGNGWEMALVILFLVFLAPLAEEILFRGFLLPPLLALGGYWTALFFCGLIFSLLHFSALSFLSLLVGGMGFALLYTKSRSVFCSVIAHSVWNAIAVILYFILY